VILSITFFLIIFAPLAYGGVEFWARNVILSSIALMLCAWLWRFVSLGRPRLSFPPFFLAATLFLILTTLQLIPIPRSWRELGSAEDFLKSGRANRVHLTASPDKTAAGAVFIAACLTLCFVLLNTFPHRRWVKITLTVLITVGALEALYGLVEYLTGRQHIFWYQKIHYLDEVTGTYINHNHFAGLLGPLLLLAIGAFLVRLTRFVASKSYSFGEDGRSSWIKLTATARLLRHAPASLALLLVAIGLMALALILSQSRGGLISCAIALCIQMVLLLNIRSRPSQMLHALGVLALMVAILAVILAPRVLSRFSYTQRDAPERFELWQDSAKIVRDYPLLGTGLGTYREVLPNYRPQKDFFFVAGIPQPAAINYAHNDYLQLLTECGLVGFALMTWALVATLRHLFSQFGKQRDWEVAAMGSSLLAGVIAFLLHSVVDFNMHIPANALMFCLLVSIALALAKDVQVDSRLSPLRKEL